MISQIKKLFKPKGPERPILPGLVAQGDADAAKIMLGLVEENCLSREMMAEALFASVKGRDANISENLDSLARITASKMAINFPETIGPIHEKLLSSVRNPEQDKTANLRLLSKAEMVFIEHGIIRNGKLIDIMEAVADGLARAQDDDKKQCLWDLGKTVRGKLPDDVKWVYGLVFELAANPNHSDKCTQRVVLQAYERREKKGTTCLGGVVARRIEKTLDRTYVLSDGDTSLSRPRRWRMKNALAKVTGFLNPRSRNQLAHGRQSA